MTLKTTNTLAVRGLRNNNPGNIRHSSVCYEGEIASQDKSFKSFGTMSHGYRAIFVILHTYSRKHKLRTLRQMINRYAPDTENDTSHYLSCVSRWAQVDADQTIDTHNKEVMIRVVTAISRMEVGIAHTDNINEGWNLYSESWL